VSESTTAIEDTVTAVERALAKPAALSATRRAIAADLFHEPGAATARCAAALYEAIGLEPFVVNAFQARVGGAERAALRAMGSAR